MLVNWLCYIRLNANCPVATVCSAPNLYNVLCLKYTKINETKRKYFHVKILCLQEWSDKKNRNKAEMKLQRWWRRHTGKIV